MNRPRGRCIKNKTGLMVQKHTHAHTPPSLNDHVFLGRITVFFMNLFLMIDRFCHIVRWNGFIFMEEPIRMVLLEKSTTIYLKHTSHSSFFTYFKKSVNFA